MPRLNFRDSAVGRRLLLYGGMLPILISVSSPLAIGLLAECNRSRQREGRNKRTECKSSQSHFFSVTKD